MRTGTRSKPKDNMQIWPLSQLEISKLSQYCSVPRQLTEIWGQVGDQTSAFLKTPQMTPMCHQDSLKCSKIQAMLAIIIILHLPRHRHTTSHGNNQPKYSNKHLNQSCGKLNLSVWGTEPKRTGDSSETKVKWGNFPQKTNFIIQSLDKQKSSNTSNFLEN